jgi:glycosyltransferase involved in cell wall biosynthesis
VIAGDPREDFSPYRTQIERLGITKNVILDLRHIPFSELSKYFAACDVVALPYRRIYQSGVLQLAYGFGRPVVVTDVGGLGDVVRSDRTGVIAPTPDAPGVASAIRQLLADPAGAAEMGTRARHHAETTYSWATIARSIGDVYRSVAPVPPGSRAG